MKNILFVTSRPLEYNASSSLRKINTIKSLLNNNCKVTVLSTETPSNGLNYTNDISNLDIVKIEIPIDTVYSQYVAKNNTFSLPKRIIKKIIKSILGKFSLYDPLITSLKNIQLVKDDIEEEYDAIISVSDPKTSHLLFKALLDIKSIKYKKYIQIWGDPMLMDITKNRWLPKAIIKKEEHSLIELADIVYYVSPLTLREQKEMYPQNSKKMKLLYPGYLEEKRYRSVNTIENIGYFGDYPTVARNIKPLYEAVKETNFKLTICGNSNISLAESKNHVVHERMPYGEIQKLEEKMDLLVHLSNKTGTQIPGKIYQYMGTNKPILFILDGRCSQLRDHFSKFNRVYFCANEANEIKDTLKIISEDIDKSSLNIEPIQEFSYKKIGLKIIEDLK